MKPCAAFWTSRFINDKTLREWIFNVKRILFTKKGRLEAIQAQDPVMFVLLGGGLVWLIMVATARYLAIRPLITRSHRSH